MVQREAAVTGVLGLEKTHLVHQEVVYYVAVACSGKEDEPCATGKAEGQDIHKNIGPAEGEAEALDTKPYGECKSEDKESHRALCEDGKAGGKAAQGRPFGLVFIGIP